MIYLHIIKENFYDNFTRIWNFYFCNRRNYNDL